MNHTLELALAGLAGIGVGLLLIVAWHVAAAWLRSRR